MKSICNFCKHQTIGPNQKGLTCYRAVTSIDPDGYGAFKQGAQCIHDSDLEDMFEPRTGEEIHVRNMVTTISNQRKEIDIMRDTIN